mmetsp:Transcript_3531/g.8425  ORF Transcript_3531/g.8425 Transcript_3531/m.8425 type:complete len:205 (-) Transcript_3531:58-672(-)
MLSSSSPLPTSSCCLVMALRFALQLLLQVVTSSQLRSHFFLHVNGRLQTTQTLEGRFSFAIVFPFLFFMARQTDDEYDCPPTMEGLLCRNDGCCCRCRMLSTDLCRKWSTATVAGRKARPRHTTARRVAIVEKLRREKMVDTVFRCCAMGCAVRWFATSLFYRPPCRGNPYYYLFVRAKCFAQKQCLCVLMKYCFLNRHPHHVS